jgi:hypothetical protein
LQNKQIHKFCAQIFIAALFIIAKMWKQFKCPPNKQNVVYPYIGILFGYKKGIP